jgi:hypothetical protein
MHKLVAAAAIAAAGIAVVAAPGANAAPSPKSNPLQCFSGADDGYNGTCTQQGQSFTLDTVDGDDNPYNNYAGVYVEAQSLTGGSVTNLTLRFSYSGDTSGGSPRFTIPLASGGYLYVDTACDANQDGIVDIQEPGCIVSTSNGYHGPVSGLAGETVGDGYTFIVADQPGVVTVSDIKLGRTSPGKIKG